MWFGILETGLPFFVTNTTKLNHVAILVHSSFISSVEQWRWQKVVEQSVSFKIFGPLDRHHFRGNCRIKLFYNTIVPMYVCILLYTDICVFLHFLCLVLVPLQSWINIQSGISILQECLYTFASSRLLNETSHGKAKNYFYCSKLCDGNN